jgi:hypothetical protein
MRKKNEIACAAGATCDDFAPCKLNSPEDTLRNQNLLPG